MITVVIDGPTTARITSASRRPGKAIRVSTKRMIAASIRPPK